MRGIRLLACVLALLFLLAACQPGEEAPPSEEGTTALPEVLTEDLTAYQKYANLNSAFFFEDGETAEDRILSDAADLCMARSRYRMVKVSKQFGVDSSDFAAARGAMDNAMKNGGDLLFAAGAAFLPVLRELSVEYPDVMFFCFGPRDSGDEENLFAISCALYEGFYLAGIAAAGESNTGRLAYVADAGTPRAEGLLCANAFALGAKAANPDCAVVFASAGENRDAESVVRSLASNGYDFFAGNFSAELCRATGERAIVLSTAAAEEDAFGTVTADLSETVASILETAAQELPQTDHFVGIREKALSLSLGEEAGEQTRIRVKTAFDAIENGSFAVFSGMQPVFDEENQMVLTPAAILSESGSELVSAGETTEDPAALFSVSTVAGLTERG